MTRTEWLEQRKRFFTASDVAALCGMNSSKRASQVIGEKAGTREPEALDENLLAQVPAGRHLEAGIAAWFLADTLYLNAYMNGDNLMVSPTVPYLAATPDLVVDGQPAEIKLAGETQLPNWFEVGLAKSLKAWPKHIPVPVPDDYRVRWPGEFLRVNAGAKGVVDNWRRSRQHQLQVLLPSFGEPRAPLKYWVQNQIQMHVMSAQSGWIVGCVGGTRRIDLLYSRNDEFLEYVFGVIGPAWAQVQEMKNK